MYSMSAPALIESTAASGMVPSAVTPGSERSSAMASPLKPRSLRRRSVMIARDWEAGVTKESVV
jgi:hypothetical protein